MELAVDVRALTKRYGQKRVIGGLDLGVSSGVTGLLGPNGAGKTTLLRCLATVLAPDTGEVRVLGLDPADHAQRAALRRRIGYLPQDPELYGHFTVAQMVDYIAILKELTGRRERLDEVRRVLAEVDLSAQAAVKVKKLSGGMRQRLGIAVALVADPDFIILDEPTVGLDPEQRMRFRTLISRLGETKVVLLSTHQTEDVAALCERVVVFRAGAAVFDGTPDELAWQAEGKVWSTVSRPAGSEVFWRTVDGRYRVVGGRPQDGQVVEPTVEDGYLRLLSDTQEKIS
ncbi:ATP-binding cassette domain-containing protein [Actinosynnema sp. NPDC047251]|uniref:ABC-type transporter n=1 Tax=Saccharothrix espanaensis (strain ATCC 51144 / DSM 44229 / JCM 9112 / NBRC 15066 / NRRL 15764) TaxID=1179773 RepID=K0JVZ3_SACES|nr:ATP-binding cassette domain-containing protein [Saccharothrix espanaensis]CCH28378.1 ABC-type transporter [Saccharothrix espanaensis DSM 44229]